MKWLMIKNVINIHTFGQNVLVNKIINGWTSLLIDVKGVHIDLAHVRFHIGWLCLGADFHCTSKQIHFTGFN